MKYQKFKKIIEIIEENQKRERRLYSDGIDLIEFLDGYNNIIDMLFYEYYGEKGNDWINWYLYEKNKNSKEPQAWDEKGNPICENLKQVWELIETEKQKQNE